MEDVSAYPRQNPAAPRLRVSDNGRFLVSTDGRPFFWLGDTAWSLFHRLTYSDADHYLRDRTAKGFTVIQAVALAEIEGLTTPSAEGHMPFIGVDPLKPNEPYWRHMDRVIARANELGLVVALLPTWGDKWNRIGGAGPEIFEPENAELYGEWIGRRYRDASIAWILGGDRVVETERHRAIIRGMAAGVRRGDGGRHLITFHTQGACGSARYFHDEPWLDFNMRQNGHTADYTGRYDETRADYDRVPTKPVIDGEPIYEGIGIDFKASQLGHATAADVRRALYWNLFNGAFGHTYGHNSVWQMWEPGRAPMLDPLMSWREALDEPGAGQMIHARRLLESRPFLTRIPDDSLLVPHPLAPHLVPGAGRARFAATRDAEGSYAMVYVPVGRAFTVGTTCFHAATLRAWWFDPRNGTAQDLGTFGNTGALSFQSPTPGELLDWVLVLDDAQKGFLAPGV